MDIKEIALNKHYEWKGKIEVVSRTKVENSADLSTAYTPGVAEPCLVIKDDVDKSYELTRRWNLVAVITDGSAVLGLGDIGPEAGMPVMEGKCVLFKEFADVDAFPLCVKTQNVDELVQTIYNISGSFGCIQKFFSSSVSTNPSRQLCRLASVSTVLTTCSLFLTLHSSP